MPREIVQATADDFDDLMLMLDGAFGHEPGDFQHLLPSLYQRTAEHVRCHYALREEDRLVAALGVYPLQWHVGDQVLHVAGIGGVGTDPAWRGKGLMSELLQHAVHRIREQGFDLSWLDGQRQRYRYFGWEKAGCMLQIGLNSTNLRHESSMLALPIVDLCPLDDDRDAPALATLHQWHDAQPVRCARRLRGFEHVLRDWRAQPHLAHDEQGELVGYLVLDKRGRTVVELAGRDELIERAMVRAAVERTDNGHITIVRPALSCTLNQWLLEVAEHVTCAGMGSWQVFNWPRTVGALLSAKCAHETLPSGTVVIGLEGQPQALGMTVDAGNAQVQWTDRSPALTLDGPTLTRTLLGPVSPSQVTALPPASALLEAWCPLPAALPSQDKV